MTTRHSCINIKQILSNLIKTHCIATSLPTTSQSNRPCHTSLHTLDMHPSPNHSVHPSTHPSPPLILSGKVWGQGEGMDEGIPLSRVRVGAQEVLVHWSRDVWVKGNRILLQLTPLPAQTQSKCLIHVEFSYPFQVGELPSTMVGTHPKCTLYSYETTNNLLNR